MQIALLSLALSADGFFVGLSLGLRKIIIPSSCKAIICVMAMLLSYCSVSCGETLTHFFPDYMAKMIGAVIMLLVGLWIMFGNFVRQRSFSETKKQSFSKCLGKKTNLPVKVLGNPPIGDMDQSGVIELKEALLIGVALSIDMLGTGFGIGAVGISPMLIAPWVGLFQILFLSTGMFTSHFIKKITPFGEKMFSYLSGTILIILSLYRFF